MSAASPGVLAQVSSVVADNTGEISSALSGPLSYAYSGASITTSAQSTATATSGTGTESDPEAFASATFFFTVDQPERFTSASTLVGPTTITFVQLSDFTNQSNPTFLVNDEGTGVYADVGTLLPGHNYELQVGEIAAVTARPTNPSVTTTTSFNVDFEASVPEPASLGLVGVASIGLMKFRRRL